MYVQLNCAIVDADANNRQELTTFLGQFGVNVVAQAATAECTDPAAGSAGCPAAGDRESRSQRASDTLRRRSGRFPGSFQAISFFVMSQVMDAHPCSWMRCSLGVKEFIPLPIPEAKFAAAVERVARCTRHGEARPGHQLHADHRWLRINHRCLQRGRRIGQDFQDRAGRSGSDARRQLRIISTFAPVTPSPT